MNDALLFLAGTACLAWVSRHALRDPRSHGFFRFFAWECILGLALLNRAWWHANPRAPLQMAASLLLLVSLVLPVHAVFLLWRRGRPTQTRTDAALLPFERTSALVTTGAFRYIRHPMYTALLLLAWGLSLKHLTLITGLLALGASLALLLTALRDEAECRQYFGAPYADYMRRSKRFIPWLF